LTITTYNNLAITSATTSEGYVGGAYSFTVTTSPASTITATTTSITGLGVTFTSPTLSGTWSAAAAPATSPFYSDYTVTINASATIGGLPATATQTHTIRVWTALTFTSAPTISNVAAGVSGSMASLMGTVTGATSITIDWGNGVLTPITPTGEITDFSATNDYATEGKKNVKIIAENEVGQTVYNVLLEIGEGSGEDAGSDNTMLLLAFLFILGLMFVAGLVARNQPLIGAAIALVDLLILAIVWITKFGGL
jgi:hypothetical protein